MTVYAHSKKNEPPEKWQPLEDHLKKVAERTAECAAKFQSADWGWNAGWLHDLGKAAEEFQAYLLRSNGLDDSEYDETGHGRINHSSAGAFFATEIYDNIIGLTLAYMAAGHHAGLPDYFSADTGRAALTFRLEEGKQNLDSIRTAAGEIKKQLRPVAKPPTFVKADNFHFWLRMLFSCLVDSDFLDTESFMNPDQGEARGNFSPIETLKLVFDSHMQKMIETAPNTPVNAARREVLDSCREAACQNVGLFSLTVPTGGGKTLSGMAFALDYAVMHGKSRIIYVIPYTSIIEQTAGVLADIFGAENVVEHHSNLDPEKETQRSRLASENWDAPIIVTTNVQFFESLYSARPGRCRKLHNTINSVVILDEAQLLPPNLLDPCVHAINQLVKNYGVTFVLATATQPALPGLKQPREIIADPPVLYDRLKRTQIVFPTDLNIPFDWEDIAKELQQHDQILCVVNTRRDCYDLYKLMPKGTIHLSALMCGQHRSEKIEEIKQRLKDGLQTRVISTQLVEAGVDIDFPVVYRAFAGLDSIAQVGGRCNREGKLNDKGELGTVKVFIPPKPAPRGLLRKGEDTTRQLFSLPDFDPQHPLEFIRYFKLFYSSVNDTGTRFKTLLQTDVPHIQFRTAANEFKLIDDQAQQSVFVRYGDSGKWLGELRRIGPKRHLMRKLQRYSVNLSRRDFDRARVDGLVDEIWKGYWLWIGKYDQSHGLDLFGAGWAPEDLTV
ncbi:MAG: CRISPR-associated endonuclease Cas3'' [Thermodesulfobacteriota bacterium]|nr:CRISPR-associated endonuclease Cas3'' [Thermodesulfobacteriota bacterium]